MTKIKDVFSFLKNYNELLNPIITEIDRQIWSYNLLNLPGIEELYSIFQSNDLDELKILEIERPKLNLCPSPDKIIVSWIVEDWRNLNIENINYKESIITEALNDEGVMVEEEELFVDDEDRVESFEDWIEKRKEWLHIERPKQVGLDLYNKLFKLYADIKREPESVELILGDGNINWNSTERKINHPILFQKVKLEFDSDKPSFIISCEELKTELYTGMLRIIPSINQSMLPNVIKEAEDDIYHIADKANNIGFYKRLINIIDENGEYLEESNNRSKNPTISYNPILFLRKRNLGYSTFIDSIIDYIDLNGDEEAPDFFKTMVGDFNEKEKSKSEVEDWNENGIDKDVLLTLPANKEQLKIIKYLENYGEVLVQGPPGTGKTHTIANLIGHLLSQGKNVLVTSHTEKALTVLKDKVIEDLQSLCISLLSTNSKKGDIDATLFEIDEMNTTLDLKDSKDKIIKLESQREELINRFKEKNQELIQIRSLDYKDLIFQNETISPIDAAKFIKQYKGRYDYIPGESKDDTATIPLTDDELEFLYKSNSLINPIEEEILSNKLLNLDELPTIDRVNMNIDEYYKYKSIVKDFIPKLIFNDNLDIEIVIQLLDELDKIKNELDKLENFQKSVLIQNIRSNIHKEFWEEIFKEYDSMKREYPEYSRVMFKNNYLIPSELISTSTLSVLEEIINSGKEIPIGFMSSILKPKWKNLQDLISNDSIKIEKIDDYKNISTIISYKLKKEELINKINKLLGEEFDALATRENDLENKVDILLNKVKKAIKLYNEGWIGYINDVEKISNLDEYNELIYLDIENPIESMKGILVTILKKELDQKYYSLLLENNISKLDILESKLSNYEYYGDAFKEIYSSIKNKNKEKYKVCYKEIEEIYSKKDTYEKRIELLLKIKDTIPDWGNAIKKREGIHGNDFAPENIDLAWKWSQLNNQINRINGYNLNTIQKELDEINQKLMTNSKTLAYEKAWYHKVKNTTKEQTQAIQGWRQTIRQIGKGTGKSAPMLLKKARELMPLCQTAIPVWIMPLNKVAENFQPEKNKFDVVIIDEASQADILALSALYLGKQIIVVGDDAQVSPSTVGIKTNEMDALIQQYLQDIPLGHLFNASTSVYDMAKTSGFKSLMLTEHFRCLPEIIEFSNILSYNNKIKPLRDDSRISVRPALVPYRVPNGYRESNKINKVEAEYIASLICSCITMEEYNEKTIGVISLLGQDQAYEIDKLLQIKLNPKEYESREILCGTPAQFQGDERDIIFLSVVESPNEKGGPVRLVSESGRNDMYRKRYNVAASRAKDQMWVVYSLNPEIDLKPEDLRLKLIKHAINPLIAEHANQLSSAESDFERKVMKSLLNKGYTVYPQWKVGAYRMDMVVEDGNNRIVIECDGERWHTLDNLGDDMKRQAILERLGWRFIRIRGSEFYKDPDKTMEWIFDELESYDIRPSFSNVDKVENNIKKNNSLIDKIKTTSQNIRNEWNGEIEKNGNYDEEPGSEVLEKDL